VSPFVDLAFDGPCARLTLKRPDKLNALDRPMIEALYEGARAIDASTEARVAILSGVLRRGRHRGLGRSAAARDVARLDARRTSRL